MRRDRNSGTRNSGMSGLRHAEAATAAQAGVGCAGRRPPMADGRWPMAGCRAFSLIELVVVVGIIILLVAIAVTAVGPAMFSSQQTQVIQQLTGAINIAQVRAQNQGGFAIRIERAFKTDERGYMQDINGQTPDNGHTSLPNFDRTQAPIYLPYQQIRFLRAPREGRYYTPALDDVIKLPTGVWLAPDYALVNGTPPPAGYSATLFPFPVTDLVDPWDPSVLAANASFATNSFENFCIVFDQRGSVTELRPQRVGITTDDYYYQDQSQADLQAASINREGALTTFKYPSARGVIMYDRKKFDSYGDASTKAQYLARDGRLLYINRILGTLVEGQVQ